MISRSHLKEKRLALKCKCNRSVLEATLDYVCLTKQQAEQRNEVNIFRLFLIFKVCVALCLNVRLSKFFITGMTGKCVVTR